MHDEQCTNGNIVFQTKLHLQQTLPLLCPKPYKHPKTTKLNLNTTKEKDNGTLLCHHLLLKQRKEGRCCLLFFFLKHKEDKTHKKTTKKKPKEGRELTFKLPFCLLTFGSRFCFPIFALPFHVLSPGIFFLSSSKKKKTQRKKKP